MVGLVAVTAELIAEAFGERDLDLLRALRLEILDGDALLLRLGARSEDPTIEDHRALAVHRKAGAEHLEAIADVGFARREVEHREVRLLRVVRAADQRGERGDRQDEEGEDGERQAGGRSAGHGS